MDMSDTMAAKLFTGLLPIIEPSVSEGRIEAIDFSCRTNMDIAQTRMEEIFTLSL